MTQHNPTSSPVPGPRPDGDTEQDGLAAAIAAALRSREPDAADTTATAQRIAAGIAAESDGRSGVVTPFVRRASLVAVAGVVTSSIVVAGAGAAAAANPYTGFAAAVDGVAHAVGVDWSSMPDGYTREQYEAFWDAEYSAEDQMKLEEIWSLDSTEAKARAGQMILDGKDLPFEPGTYTTPELPADDLPAIDAFFEAGYTGEDIKALNALWDTDNLETKVRAGQMLLHGETPPVP